MKEHPYTNHLINESSPYLLQHAHNPVDWYPWGEAALQKAQKEDKLIIISIGYAACHWCHVMEQESFEDTAVARVMNENFVSVKVDREERPDIDQIYMNVAQMVGGRGGWPLNAIALPDGRPIYAATYFPKENWLQFLQHFNDLYKNEKEKLLKQAEQLTQGVQNIELINYNDRPADFNLEELNKGFDKWTGIMDLEKGGKRGAPKFPMPNNYQFLLRYYYHTKNKKALEAVIATLDNMAWGGIYDHLGGGFARYSTDADWKVPHFEKMLYDNAQLVSLYTEAYQLTKKPLYKEVVYETLGYIEREMTSPEGGFYSSLDADSEGEEGKFYVWTRKDVDRILKEESELFSEYYNITEKGNWEHGVNVLFKKKHQVKHAKNPILPDKDIDRETDKEIAKKFKISVDELKSKIDAAKALLFKARSTRVRPDLDDKILTSWNALMLKGYVDAYRVFGEKEFLVAAIKNAEFIQKNCIQKGNRLNRNYKDGKSVINAFLDDYSLTMEAFIALYQATFDEQWLYLAGDLAEHAVEHFYDERSGMFFYTSDLDPDLIARKMEVSDNVIPASNSSMAKSLYYLGLYFYDEDYIARSKQMLNNIKEDVIENLPFYSNWGWLMLHFIEEPYEVAIVGKEYENKRGKMDEHFLPGTIFLGGENEGTLELLKNKLIEGQTTIYICKDKACKQPVTQVKEALELID